MANALEARGIAQHKILVMGDTGSGKTSQILTLPGKKFAYLFDPNALLTLRGHDVTYEEFLPENLSLSVKSLSGKVAGDKPSNTGAMSNLYQQWEKHFNDSIQNGLFSEYDWICFDSATTFLDLIMDRVLTINGRFGQWPQQDDYGPQMMAFTNVVRSITGSGKGVYMTGHIEIKQDELTKRIWRQPMMTGRLAKKIPLLFSDIFISEADTATGEIRWKLQTVPDKMTTCVRSSIQGLEPFEDVTRSRLEQGSSWTGSGRTIELGSETMKEHWSALYLDLIEDCLDRDDKISEWEGTFLDSLREQIVAGHRPSAKQMDILDNIWEKATAKG